MQSIIIVTFTKLLVIKIVANNRSVSDNKFVIFLSDGCFPSAIAFKSEGEREKKAISEADANPDTNNSKPANTIATIADIDGVCTDMP